MQDMPENFRMGEMGSLGLKSFNGVSREELIRELNFPQSVKTFREMSYHPSINSPLTLFENLIAKVEWNITPPENATEEEIKQCKIIASMMHDMDQPWEEFLSDVLSVQLFGFSVHEKVYRRREIKKGSKYNDSLIGWKKLALRSQDSIEKFIFSDDGNEIIGVKQNVSGMGTDGRFIKRATGKMEVILPRSKFLHFRVGKHRGDPFGKSPLRDAYTAWRFLTEIEEIEASGVAKDLVGLPILRLPPQYLSADATPEQKAIRAYYENAMRNLQMNNQSAMILPQAFDPDSKQPLFDLDLLSLDGKKGMDTGKVKEYYKQFILTALFADVLILGQSNTGSFALGQIKNSLTGAAAENLLKGIVRVLNSDLVRQTYELNGWDVSRMGTFDYDNLESVDLETLSKFWQRVASTGLVEVDREVLNVIRTAGGADARPDDEAPRTEIMSGNASRSGDGMATAGEGTSTGANPEDSTSNNLDNKA